MNPCPNITLNKHTKMYHEDSRALDDRMIIRPSYIYFLLRKMRSNQFSQDFKKLLPNVKCNSYITRVMKNNEAQTV